MVCLVFYYHYSRLKVANKYTIEEDEIKKISYNISKSPILEIVYDMLDKAFKRFGALSALWVPKMS
ncbi:hypothetical protein [Bacteroides stercorirosoris]|jgi:hypothetical protein|uniref:Uncharacterized protein n=1 Tax=Bacteroides stercorirosoris TaxID=871324 RepID=A0A1M6DUN8_9BACE|nr:hypothetical protein [Bacteroides stercorirosoris]SHI76976.1 hypothetical protein SAMN05444350_107126 [Bacteroides stercorirosoris]